MVSKNVIRGKAEVEIKAAFSKDVIRGKAVMESERESTEVIRGKTEVGI